MKNLIYLLKIIWQASPRYCTTSLVVVIIRGLLPTFSILVNARLLETLIDSTQNFQRAGVHVRSLSIILILLSIITLFIHILGKIQDVIQQILEQHITNYLQILIAEKASSLDLAFFENSAFYNLFANTASEALHRPTVILSQLQQAGTIAITFTSSGFVLFAWQPFLVALIIFGVLLKFGIEIKFGHAHFNLAMELTPLIRKTSYMYSLLTSDQAAKEIRLFQMQSWLISQYRKLLNRILEKKVYLIMRQVKMTGLLDCILALAQPGLIGFIAVKAVLLEITIGQFSLYTQAVQQLDTQLRSLLYTLAGLYENQLFVSNLFHFLALQPDAEAPRSAKVRINVAIPSIEFRNVSFHYPGTTKLVLDNLSFRILPGEKVAIVGKNGAGKTTVVKLLTGLYQPTTGQILLNDIDITMLERNELRKFLSVIFQDYSTYHFSAFENIGFGDIERICDYAKIDKAARLSGFDKVLAGLPHGYDTVIGRWFEAGHELSGGQRQLLAIARAMMRDAPILILDEPSAALDVYVEEYFFDRILNRSIQQTVLFIAHRFTSIRRANRILVIEEGHLQEQGSHEELLYRGEHYAELFKLQSQMYICSKESSQNLQAEEVNIFDKGGR
jgi:ATP-binding cassette, subfamily B, bacterial